MFNHKSDSPDIIDNTKIAYTINGKEYFTDLKTAKEKGKNNHPKFIKFSGIKMKGKRYAK